MVFVITKSSDNRGVPDVFSVFLFPSIKSMWNILKEKHTVAFNEVHLDHHWVPMPVTGSKRNRFSQEGIPHLRGTVSRWLRFKVWLSKLQVAAAVARSELNLDRCMKETRKRKKKKKRGHKPVIVTLLHTPLWCGKWMHGACQTLQAVGPRLGDGRRRTTQTPND